MLLWKMPVAAQSSSELRICGDPRKTFPVLKGNWGGYKVGGAGLGAAARRAVGAPTSVSGLKPSPLVSSKVSQHFWGTVDVA